MMHHKNEVLVGADIFRPYRLTFNRIAGGLSWIFLLA
jgi:hypothetical protein